VAATDGQLETASPKARRRRCARNEGDSHHLSARHGGGGGQTDNGTRRVRRQPL